MDTSKQKKLTISQWFTLRSMEYVAIVILLMLFGGEGTFEEVLKAAVVIFFIVRLLVWFKVLR
jgi:hypothetical protein